MGLREGIDVGGRDVDDEKVNGNESSKLRKWPYKSVLLSTA